MRVRTSTTTCSILSLLVGWFTSTKTIQGFNIFSHSLHLQNHHQKNRPFPRTAPCDGLLQDVVVDTSSWRRSDKVAHASPPLVGRATVSAVLVAATLLSLSLFMLPLPSVAADDGGGASSKANAKITTGGASTLQSGRTISITRGVNLDNSNFSGQNLKGVAFQQSIVRDSDFSKCNLVGSSFFDATLDGTNFEDADMTMANIEMAQFNRANLKGVVAREMYVSGATILEGIKSIENSDWTDTYLRADQQKYLCNHPTAKGTNPTTGADTRESLQCKD